MAILLKCFLLRIKWKILTVLNLCILSIIFILIANLNSTVKHPQPLDYQTKFKKKVIDIFYNNNIFLADVGKLLEISIFQKSKTLETNFLNYFQTHEKLSFGCFFKDLKNIKNQVY